MSNKKAFTLVELIIVIAIIAILAGAIFVAIDPARRLHEARNSRRRSDVNTILDAVKKYQVDNAGDHYDDIDDAQEDEFLPIASEALFCNYDCTAVTLDNDCIDLGDLGSEYLAVIPVDPKSGDQDFTGYFIHKDSNGAITIGACEPEGEGPGGGGTPPAISITR